MTPEMVSSCSDRDRRVSIYDVDVCAICGEIGVMHKCSWTAEREISIPATEIAVGDRMKIGHYAYRRVDIVMRSHDCKTIFCWLHGMQTPHTFNLGDVTLGVGGMDRPSQFQLSILGLRKAPCGAACCERCSCERAAGRHICAAHWMDWSKVA